jgi:hypothetical protein
LIVVDPTNPYARTQQQRLEQERLEQRLESRSYGCDIAVLARETLRKLPTWSAFKVSGMVAQSRIAKRELSDTFFFLG